MSEEPIVEPGDSSGKSTIRDGAGMVNNTTAFTEEPTFDLDMIAKVIRLIGGWFFGFFRKNQQTAKAEVATIRPRQRSKSNSWLWVAFVLIGVILVYGAFKLLFPSPTNNKATELKPELCTDPGGLVIPCQLTPVIPVIVVPQQVVTETPLICKDELGLAIPCGSTAPIVQPQPTLPVQGNYVNSEYAWADENGITLYYPPNATDLKGNFLGNAYNFRCIAFYHLLGEPDNPEMGYPDKLVQKAVDGGVCAQLWLTIINPSGGDSVPSTITISWDELAKYGVLK